MRDIKAEKYYDNDSKRFELRYWRIDEKRNFWGKRFPKIEKIFELEKCNFKELSVVDIGCGPYGGIFYKYDAKEMWVIDPLINTYKEQNLWKNKKDLNEVALLVEDVNFHNKFDCVIAINSIDHGYNIWKAIDSINNMLKKDGIVKFLVHCRTKSQLNKGHRQSYSEEDLIEYLNKYFDTSSLNVSNTDPIDGKGYTTVYGELRKQ